LRAHTVASTQIRKPRIIKNSTAKTGGVGAWLIRRLIPRSPTEAFTLTPAGIRRETEAPTGPNGVIIVTLPLDALGASTVAHDFSCRSPASTRVAWPEPNASRPGAVRAARHATDEVGAVIAFTVSGSEGPNEKWGVCEGRSSVPVGDLESLH